jgi:GAF domain-containing protein
MTERTTDYPLLAEQARGLLSVSDDAVANAANLSALIYNECDRLNWVGFYFLKDGELIVGPFQGRPACVRIALGQGVCGTAASERRSLRVADVHAFDGHIVCDVDSRSELVIPLLKNGNLLGVLDIDSPVEARFTDHDQRGFEQLAEVYIKSLAQ